MQKFTTTQTQAIKQYYQDNGYVVLRRLIPDGSIDAFLKEYRKVKDNDFFVFYSQYIHKAIRPKLTSGGYIKESMENPSRLKFFPGFSSAIERCLFHTSISEVLKGLSGHKKHTMWQNMFFDFSTGTIEHQDHWYLDTNPPGSLVGVWYALEDIHPDSGPFFVLPKSHRGEVLDSKNFSDHEKFRLAVMDVIKANSYEVKNLCIEKGDVVFWHPYTIHGAQDNQNPKHSRKSFTAHFFPLGMERKRYPFPEPPLKPTINPELFTAYQGSDIAWHLKNYGKYFRDSFLPDMAVVKDMRRRSYS